MTFKRMAFNIMTKTEPHLAECHLPGPQMAECHKEEEHMAKRHLTECHIAELLIAK